METTFNPVQPLSQSQHQDLMEDCLRQVTNTSQERPLASVTGKTLKPREQSSKATRHLSPHSIAKKVKPVGAGKYHVSRLSPKDAVDLQNVMIDTSGAEAGGTRYARKPSLLVKKRKAETLEQRKRRYIDRI